MRVVLSIVTLLCAAAAAADMSVEKSVTNSIGKVCSD